MIFAGCVITQISSRANAETLDEANPAALVAARELFREATVDADAGRFEVALGKFKRVAEVKETAAVRFNIARCEEQLGKLAAALNDYETAARDGASEPKSGEIVKMAEAKAGEIRPRIPRLTIMAPPHAPPDLIVKLDGQKEPTATLGVPLPADPGRHTIEATGQNGAFTKEVELRETEAITVAIDLEVPRPVGRQEERHEPERREHVIKPEAGRPNRVPGFIGLGIGGALGIASLAFVVLHNDKAHELATQKSQVCTQPGGLCPLSQADRLRSLQSDAKTFEGLAIGLGVGAAVALGIGTVLIVYPPDGSKAKPGAASGSARIVPTPGGGALLMSF